MTIREGPAAGFVLVLLAVACAPEPDKGIDRLAQFYVDRQLDSLPVSPDSAAPLQFDSTALDSVTTDWTPDDWMEFWRKVEQKKPYPPR